MCRPTRIIKVDGKPGAGKTTELFDEVELLYDDGVPMNRLLYLTFTKEGTRETRERLRDVYDVDLQDEDECEALYDTARTFHSAALQACRDGGLISDVGAQVISPDEDTPIYRAFAREHGLTFSATLAAGNREDAPDMSDVPAANRVLAIDEWLTLRRLARTDVTPADVRRGPIPLPRGAAKTARLVRSWRSFKETGGADPETPVRLYEHHDYVTAAVEGGHGPPRAGVLFVDEFQDLSPLEHALFEAWLDSGRFVEAYVAGDASQCIYTFRGADPSFFLDLAADEHRRKKDSHRVTSDPGRVVRGVLDVHPATDHGGFAAQRTGGVLEKKENPDRGWLASHVRLLIDEYGDDEDTVYVLGRTNRHAQTFTRELREGGVPYLRLGREGQLWSERVGACYRALCRLVDRDGPLLGDLRELIKALDGSEDGDRAQAFVGADESYEVNLKAADQTRPTRYAQAVRAVPELCIDGDAALDDALVDVVRGLPFSRARREAIATAILNGARHSQVTVKVGTIHSAKGLESTAVVLFTDVSATVRDAYDASERQAAEEHRLYYVGASRASERLCVVVYRFDGPTSQVFTGGIPVTEPPSPPAATDDSADDEPVATDGGEVR